MKTCTNNVSNILLIAAEGKENEIKIYKL